MNSYLLIILFFIQISFTNAQTNRLIDLFNDVQNVKVLKNPKENGFIAKSSIQDFESYLYLHKNMKTDTIEAIALMNESKILGVLSACPSCEFYSSIKITSKNIFLPTLALSTHRNGKIDRASFESKKNRTVTVGDNNYDKKIDYASYYLGNGLYGVLLISQKLDSVKGFLIFNSFSQEYIGILTLKKVGQKNTFNKCFVKARTNWNSYNIGGSKNIFLASKNEVQLLNESFPDLEKAAGKKEKIAIDTLMISENATKFISFMKATFQEAKSRWLEDYKSIKDSKVIGLTFPKLVLIDYTTGQIKSVARLQK
jgi:hypothetical protein